MSTPVTKKNLQPVRPDLTPVAGWGGGFRRTQLALGWWGVLLVSGGWLHNTFSRPWGTPLTLGMWAGLSVAGLTGSYLLTRDILNSGMLFVWGGVLALAFALTLLIIYPLSLTAQLSGRIWLSAVWHLLLLTGYVLTGYYMDRRLWLLAGWEGLVIIGMLWLNLSAGGGATPVPAPVTTPRNPNTTPLTSDTYGQLLLIDARPVLAQITGNNEFDLTRNLGLLFGLTSGGPLLLAALPVWKEHYARN